MVIKRKFGITVDGQPGLFPSVIEHGDEIALISGLSLPMAILRYANDGERFLLLGECYLHGVMEGEMWADSHSVKLEFV